MRYCSNVLAVVALGCQIAQCLNDSELSLLSADLELLSDTLGAIAEQRAQNPANSAVSSSNCQ